VSAPQTPFFYSIWMKEDDALETPFFYSVWMKEGASLQTFPSIPYGDKLRSSIADDVSATQDGAGDAFDTIDEVHRAFSDDDGVRTDGLDGQ
jgi:hypothetical protein